MSIEEVPIKEAALCKLSLLWKRIGKTLFNRRQLNSEGPDDDDATEEQLEADVHGDDDDDNDDWLIWSTSEKRRKRSLDDADVDATCPANGVFDLGACKFGTPLVMSWWVTGENLPFHQFAIRHSSHTNLLII